MVERVAVPLGETATLPMSVVPSRKVIVPAGIAPLPVTVAVSVRFVPAKAGLALDPRATVVEAIWTISGAAFDVAGSFCESPK